ncbi:cdk-9 [Symbiodinium natans]|uniref:Cyclin-dependent kinase 2 homolog n=1 Tax=Symbiodinium natans TaxID=878477 RepID=A0A812U252_9DINO|nr:cdk-9 [Symbiodinium natans]
MASDDSSDDEYWGSYTRTPQENFSIPSLGQARSEPWPGGRESEAAQLVGKEFFGGCSLSTTCSQDATEMETDATVSVDSQTFKLHNLLGFGSFGSVWMASCTASGRIIALKEVQSSSNEGMEAAMLEAKRLRALRELIQDDRACAALPYLVCAGTVLTSTGYRTLLAMEHIPGAPLQQALEAGQLCAHKLHPMAQAFRVAATMLGQISAAMCHVSSRFFHRDVNSHNILVQVMTGQLSFGLIDFGLAVDSEIWRAGGWRMAGAAGDGRYWTISSWLLFSRGTDALSADQDLQSEYANFIDLHSAGLSVLQTLAVLSKDGPLVPTCKEEEAAFLTMEHLGEVWKQYWCHASACWQQVLDAFNSDARNEIKVKLAEEMVHDTFAAYFVRLRVALEQALASFRCLPDTSGGSRVLGGPKLACGVLEALLIMISTGRPWRGQAGWKEVGQLLSEEKTGIASDASV